ncbi:glycosyltransferase [Mesorhizobium sp. B2-4-13]|uniref:glycosyltransferase family 2 protein n=1 Tax=Mesorhizobium sp. B2-4-13 TaxID=2589936 RepID=UPI00115314E2|nr:glycosyltransferase [Mesorhizobium sp. B2-4-13]TPK86593.1 glycosyltransferase [Mesorhizobium sp. B2-4-13]
MNGEAFRVRQIDLGSACADADVGDTPSLSIFWWKDLPLGMRASLPDELPYSEASLRQFAAEFSAAQLAARNIPLGAPLRATYEGSPKSALCLTAALGADDLVDRLDELATASSASAQHISVVICTRDRGPALAECLQSVARQRSAPGEVIVVDNSRDGNARPVCVGFPEVRFVHEPRPGLSVARSAGIRESRQDIIAFTDDDVEVHPGWTAEIARAFEERDIEALTGLVLPARLDTIAQRRFQFDMGGFGSTFVPLLFDHRFFEETRPSGAHVWKIGAGANMAFRRSAFDRVGSFDERLGAGAAGCSEDSELWYRLLAAGGTCLYEPRAVVFHHHRRDWPGFRRQIRAYMKGHVAALVTQYDNFGNRGNIDRIWKQLPAYFLRTFVKGLFEGPPGRTSILAAEVEGWLAGLQFLVRFGWRKRRTSNWLRKKIDDPQGAARTIPVSKSLSKRSDGRPFLP